ncbi:MAG: alpha-amylase, partial [Acidobacteria bacterium]|nr:alpha-amylase [Acidobacteriota bacterium]
LYALGLLHELYQELLAGYRLRRNPGVLQRAVRWLQEGFGHGTVERMLRHTADLFPTADGGPPPDEEFLLHKALVLWLFNDNPAAAGARELFDDRELEATTHYHRLIADLETFFAAEPGYGSGEDSLFRLLRSPVERAPGSLSEQLELALAIEERVSRPLRDRLRRGLDVLREEHRPPFAPVAGPPPEPSAAYAELRGTTARYPIQRPWMRELVLVAKHTDVWLHQLSRAHGRRVERLDQIPDAALEALRELGFNGLWLLGLWQRSTASGRIKRAAGDPRAAASAYAVTEYRVAEHLGGDDALEALSRRAADHGLRLAGDFVPNHTALDARWVIEHPERFVGSATNPFPGYTFTGDDLSDDPRVGLYLEDHYRDRSDAAVVFQRVDRQTGEVRYLFHGNDGTGLPWNDTAQLDFLRAETRRAVIDELVAVARRLPIVRLDAAMALVRRHVLRLWYPAPGEGGA